MISLGLLGKNINHSKSKSMYEKIYSQKIHYVFFDCMSDDVVPGLDVIFSKVNGLSITAPYKKHFLNDVALDPRIERLLAINCIRHEGGKYFGTNTDYFAICDQIDEFILQYKKIDWVILGDGTMSFVTRQILDKKNQDFTMYSRRSHGKIEMLKISSQLVGAKLVVINTCSRDFNFSGKIDDSSIFWDFNYNLEYHSNFFSKSLITYLDGLKLLADQAVYATRFWNFSI